MAVKRSQIRRFLKSRFSTAGRKSLQVKGAAVAAGLGVLALVVLVASRQPAPVAETAAMEAAPAAAPAADTAAARRARARREESAVNAAVASERAAAGRSSGASQDGIVTISGCLEQDDDVFRLKDTDGEAAPKSRSWKSGFLKKRSAKVEVVDASNRLKLESHVGRRVSVTGQLHEKEMLASSVRRVGASCS
jgi:hypothetical protein